MARGVDLYVWHLFARSNPPRRLRAFGGPADGRRLPLQRRIAEFVDVDGGVHVYIAGRVRWSDAKPVFVYMGPKHGRPHPPRRHFDDHVDDFDDCGFPSE